MIRGTHIRMRDTVLSVTGTSRLFHSRTGGVSLDRRTVHVLRGNFGMKHGARVRILSTRDTLARTGKLCCRTVCSRTVTGVGLQGTRNALYMNSTSTSPVSRIG